VRRDEEERTKEATRKMKYRMKRFPLLGLGILGLLTLTAGIWLAHSSARAQSAVMRVEPSSQSVDVGGGKFTVDVAVDGVTNLGAYEFELHFDPDVLRFVGVENGPFLGSTGRVLRCQTPWLVDPGTGGLPDALHFGCATNDPTPAGPNGSGLLATVTFAPKTAGTSPLTLVVEGTGIGGLADVQGGAIPVQPSSGTVTVVGTGPAATAEPDEPTAIPTKEYVEPVHATATPGGDWMFTPEPGETPMTRPMPGRQMERPSADSIAAAASPSGASSTSSAGGSPRAGSGPPENGTPWWLRLAESLLVAGGVGLLAMSIHLNKGRERRDNKREL
jgi:hypothetical protein